jgi:hypothetical protein
MREAKKQKIFLTGNQPTGIIRIFLNYQEITLCKEILKPVI